MTQQFDVLGQPLNGGQLFVIVAGTVSTPQDAFADVGLTIKQPYPMQLDAAGRVPQFFLSDPSSGGNATVKIRLQDKNGVVQLAADNVLVIGPSGGTGGSGATIDPTTVFQTGDLKARYAVGIHPGTEPGWVRCNALTIGNASSGATERAAAVCQALFQFLWPNTDLVVSGGRGANAAADWGAGRTITTPDYRGYALAALDDMGNAASGRLTAAFFGTAATVLGAVGGAESLTLDKTQIPAHKHSGSTIAEAETHNHNIQRPTNTHTEALVTTGASSFFWTGDAVPPNVFTGNNNQTHTHGFTTDNGEGGGLAHRTLGPRKLCTIYIKL
jgi:microcystin-dependent protein